MFSVFSVFCFFRTKSWRTFLVRPSFFLFMWLALKLKFNKSYHVQNSFHGLLWPPSRETHTLHFSTRPVPRFNHQGSVFSAFTHFEIFLILLPNSHQNKAWPEDVAPTKHPHKKRKCTETDGHDVYLKQRLLLGIFFSSFPNKDKLREFEFTLSN